MKRSESKKNVRFAVNKGTIFTLVTVLLYGLPANAQSESSNSTMKAVFAEVKSELNSNDFLSTILGILAVLLVVGVAMWLSFRTPDKSLK